MKIRAIRTKKFLPPKDSLLPELYRRIHKIQECSILAMSSKVVSIDQGRCVPLTAITSKDELIEKEADFYIPRKLVPGNFVVHTIKNSALIPSAGIDTSNSNGYYILWPKYITKITSRFHKEIVRHYRLKKFGIIITDSHSIPLRRGVIGISLSYYGFRPLNDYRSKKDLFNVSIKMSQANIPDALAAAAVLEMGEGNEQTPFALITNVPFVTFGTRFKPKIKQHSSFNVPLKKDLYYPFLGAVKWKKKK